MLIRKFSMKVVDQIKKTTGYILDLVFPISCIICGTEGVFLCEKCALRLPRLEKQRCSACFTAAPFGKTHPECLTKQVLDGAVAALDYKHPDTKKVITIYKYRFITDLSKPLGDMITEQLVNLSLQGFFTEFQVIPVPLHKKRFTWRGFNQAELLAEELSSKMKLALDKHLVIRVRHTKPQVKLDKEGRRKNIDNAFELTRTLTAKKYLLIDDVITSGSTLHEIAKLLKQKGAAEVWALTLAHG